MAFRLMVIWRGGTFLDKLLIHTVNGAEISHGIIFLMLLPI